MEASDVHDPGDESMPRKPEQVTSTITFFEPPSPAMRKIAQWWLDTAAQDFAAISSKIAEYGGIRGGSADLRLMGDNLAELLGWNEASEATRQSLACWLYLQGKIARLVSDFQQQRPPKDDTLLDISVYAMMMRRLNATGNWP